MALRRFVAILALGTVCVPGELAQRLAAGQYGQGAPATDDLFADTGPLEATAGGMSVGRLVRGEPLPGDPQSGALTARLDFLSVRTIWYRHPGQYRPETVAVYQDRLRTSAWDCFIHTRSSDESLDLCRRAGLPAGENELAMIKETPVSVILLDARGRLTLAQLDQLGRIAAERADR